MDYLRCIFQFIVKDSKQLLWHGKVMSIYDYFTLDDNILF